MLIASFPAGPLQTNCYVVASAPDAECVVVDPGMGATELVHQVVTEQNLTPVAVLATHGHLDHVFSMRALTEHYQVPAYIGDDDRPWLSLPYSSLAMDVLSQTARQLAPGTDALTPPETIHSYADGSPLALAGLTITTHHAPGHTPGCTLLEVPYSGDETGSIDRVIFTGDVLFAGGIGRTDLPGGNHATMLQTLRTVVLTLPDTAAILPGHGGQSTLARERATNPYLQEDML